jgi:hypothetical protein
MAMTSRDPAHPSTTSGENGEEQLDDAQPQPGAEARQQADEVTNHRTAATQADEAPRPTARGRSSGGGGR